MYTVINVLDFEYRLRAKTGKEKEPKIHSRHNVHLRIEIIKLLTYLYLELSHQDIFQNRVSAHSATQKQSVQGTSNRYFFKKTPSLLNQSPAVKTISNHILNI
jgi:hypothetical protein